MSTLLCRLSTCIALLLPAAAAQAATPSEQPLTTVTEFFIAAFVVCVIIVIALVYFGTFRDKRRTELSALLAERRPVHSVAPDTLVIDCVRSMSANKIGALIVVDGERLVGIFTERDALNKVLAAARDPGKTKVSEVMTRDPYSIAPTMTVGDAMRVVTGRRFRHLPIVQGDKVLGLISSGDLTHWLVKDQTGEVQELVGMATKS